MQSLGEALNQSEIAKSITTDTSTTTSPSCETNAEPKCLACRDRGYRLQQSKTRSDFWETLPCPDCEVGRNEAKRLEGSRLAAMFAYAKVPTIYQRASIEDFTGKNKEAALLCLEGTSLFAYGRAGTGKTHLAVAILKRRIGEHKTALFTTGADLWDAIRATFGNNGLSADDLIEAAKTVDCLVLDDLGAERLTDWVREKAYQIINARYNWGLQTVLTSNRSLAELGLPDSLGDRTVSRLAGMCKVLEMKGKDRRLCNAEA